MGAEGERSKRAGDYVSGLMNETERARAERDLEMDPAFREAVLRIAEEVRLFDRPASPDENSQRWNRVMQRIAQLPQMREVDTTGLAEPPHSDSRRHVPGASLRTLPSRRAIFVV